MAIDALELSQALIRCPSVTPTDAGSQHVLRDALEAVGFKCHAVTFSDDDTPDVTNLYARIGDQSPNLCFAGHTDVVPIGDADAWTDDPFEATIRDGVLFGRGASDMKAAIACFVAAASRFLEARDGDFNGSLSFLITGDEEGTAVNGTQKLLDWITDQGETLDACIVGEPTNPLQLGDMIKIGRRGSLNGYLTVFGTQGHTAYPHLADNPVHRAAAMVTALTAAELDQGSDHFQPSTLQVSTMDVANATTNVIPAKAQVVFNIRFNDLHRAHEMESWVRAKLDGVGGDYDLRVRVTGESFLTPPGPLSAILSTAVQEVTGKTPELSTSGGTSDARFIKDYCPVAEFGMVGRTMHQTNECIEVADIDALSEIYLKTMDNFFA